MSTTEAGRWSAPETAALFMSALFMLSNLAVDVLYVVIDPRIRRG